ncbi:prolyl oligopeptidase family serine peptidase [Krasilnikovia sp. MM14-A1259]|uniref:S9 family peptidase n=1 Tax=Krasilnikovia sp. MM14-A1259 TaxID=3373539 RepID=UPI003808680E
MVSYRDFRPRVRVQMTVAVSPDGDMVAYSDDTLGQFNVAVQPLAGGEARHLTAYTDDTVRRVVWHPDGKSIVYAADAGGTENHQLYRVDVIGGDPQPLTANPSASHALALGNPFSPDGRWLAYSANDREPGDQDVLIRHLDTGQVRRLYAGGGRVYAGHWSPDGSLLTATHWIDANSHHVIYVVDIENGSATRITSVDPAATYWLGPWLPDGSGFLVESTAGREFTGLAVLRLDGSLEWLDTPDWDVEQTALSRGGSTLVWTVNVDGSSALRVRDMTTGVVMPGPDLPAGQLMNLSVSADGRTVAALLSTALDPWHLVTMDLPTGELHRLTDAAPAAATTHRFVEPELVRIASRDGHHIAGYLYRPNDTNEPVAVVISVHGGPVYQERPIYMHDGLYQYLLANGVAVLAPNIRGSSGYGQAYIESVYRDWGGGDLRDLADTVTYLRQQTWVDPERVGIYGASYGGFVVLSAVARLPELNWAAAVDHCGISNLLTLAEASPPTIRSLVHTVIGDPEHDADFLRERSPVTYVDRIRAPLFIIQGGNDPRVPPNESEQVVTQLRARGVDVRYDCYPDEGHVFTKVDNQIRSKTDAADFLIGKLGFKQLDHDLSGA